MSKYYSNIVLLLLCFVVPKGYVGLNFSLHEHFTFHFTHANVFHLLSNFIFTAYFCPRWSTVLLSYLIASGASFMPFTGMSMPTCGMSAMCFAMIARHDVAWRVLNWRLLLFNSVLIFVPNANWKIHIASYALSFAIWKLYYLTKTKA